MPEKYLQPQYNASLFTCPHCGGLTSHSWVHLKLEMGPNTGYSDIARSSCAGCKDDSYWLRGNLIFPRPRHAAALGEHFPESIRAIYNEAASILLDSPRAATALLRLCVELVCFDKGAEGNNLFDSIGKLVGAGIDKRIQQALDSIRVLGNAALHPSETLLHEQGAYQAAAISCFKLINYLDTRLYEEPAQIESVYAGLPDPQLEAIDRRDNTDPAS